MHAYRLLLILSFAAVLVGCNQTATSADAAKKRLSAREIIKRMKKVYADCKSYRDSGTINGAFADAVGSGLGPHRWKQTFTTVFVAPNRFCFTIQDISEQDARPSPHAIVLFNKGKLQSWCKDDWFKEHGLEWVLLTAGHSSARFLPSLLLPGEIKLGGVDGLHGLSVDEDTAKVNGHPCFRIQGKFDKEPVTLWVDEKTFLLRAIEDESRFKTSLATSIVTFNPEINVTLDESAFSFQRPKDSDQ